MLLTAVLSALLCGCPVPNPVIDQLPEYERKEFYTSGGFQDYTDYAKYRWDTLKVGTVLKTGFFQEITGDSRETILRYIDDFEGWVDIIGGELKENYDFDKSRIEAGDYVCIMTDYDLQDELRAFWNYSLYYYDVDANMIYYFHNNI